MELVGILNITPDSFSDGGQFLDAKAALAHTDELFAQGASLVDVGAESTRPNATPLTPDEEWGRLEKVLPTLLQKYPGKISLDTYHPETVERAAAFGPFIVNDVTGFANPAMIEVVARHKLPCIISHLPTSAHGDIQRAHSGPLLDDIHQVRDELLERKKQLEQAGVTDTILDPGIGFGKTPELNWQLLEFAREVPGERVMIGYSRKRFLGEERMELAPNIAAGRIATTAGTRYLRVHDVAGHHSLLA